MKLLLHKYQFFLVAMLGLSTSYCVAIEASTRDLAEWTVLSYIQADNDLAELADCQIVDMQQGLLPSKKVNMLVQLDRPNSNKTWRYKIVSGGKIDDGSLDGGMGYHPENELVDAMRWIKETYPARRYALILSNHGSGVQDLRSVPAKNRGILYDDSQGTVLTNTALASALTRIKGVLGKEIDVVGMDACLMAMLEVAYQIKASARYFVGSQQTEPGEGWSYAPFLKQLSASPSSTTPLQLAQNMVNAFKDCYKKVKDVTDFTQSAIDLSRIETIKQNIDQLVECVAICTHLDGATTKAMVLAARKACIEFDMPEYIDLYSLYSALLSQIKLLTQKGAKSDAVIAHITKKDKKYISPEYGKALDALKDIILDGMSSTLVAVVGNVSGPQFPAVCGISIYYPRYGQIHESYLRTLFAKNSKWPRFIQNFR